jgi:hypothetical protein
MLKKWAQQNAPVFVPCQRNSIIKPIDFTPDIGLTPAAFLGKGERLFLLTQLATKQIALRPPTTRE